jgi:endonuclease/exonuclease/phosphatase family metal-dependent hydrolase
MTKNTIKIATWNISGGVSKETDENLYFDQEKSSEIDETFLNDISKIINEEKIDIICFQDIITTKRIQYIDKLVKNTNLKNSCFFELSDCNLVKDTMAGIAILSKYKINESNNQLFINPKLSKTTSSGAVYGTYDKGCLTANIQVGDKTINVITNHGFPFRRFDSTPEAHMDIFADFYKTICNYKDVIVTGDFNAENIMKLLPNAEEKLTELFGEITTTDGKKFDNILIDKKFKMIDKKLVKSVSDHFMCIATIEI